MPDPFASRFTFRVGDCRELLKDEEPNSKGGCVTDTPYELVSIAKRFGKPGSAPCQHGTDGAFARASRGFMGMTWDATGVAFDPETWKEVYRVLKPGAYLAAFGGDRTFHRMVCAIEDAGFQIERTLVWCYSTGMPKSRDIGKDFDFKAFSDWLKVQRPQALPFARRLWNATDEDARAWRWCQLAEARFGPLVGKRPVVAVLPQHGAKFPQAADLIDNGGFNDPERTSYVVTGPSTPEAQQWDGYGTDLKPAVEMICLAQKPISESSIAENVRRWGVGVLNINACRLPRAEGDVTGWHQTGSDGTRGYHGTSAFRQRTHSPEEIQARCGGGRWPPNMLLSHGPDCTNEGCAPGCPVGALDAQSNPKKGSGAVKVAAGGANRRVSASLNPSGLNTPGKVNTGIRDFGDSGGASRFFPVFPYEAPFLYFPKPAHSEKNAGLGERNPHPTPKPVSLMRFLLRLCIPPGEDVLEPFLGSGGTSVAAALEGYSLTGFDLSEEYVDVAEARTRYALKHPEALTLSRPRKPKAVAASQGGFLEDLLEEA